MSLINYHLYLIFILENNFFGINVQNLMQLYRFHGQSIPESYLIPGPEKDITIPVINLKSMLIQSDYENAPSTGFPWKIPTLIDVVSPVSGLKIDRIGIIADYAIGIHQFAPDDINPVVHDAQDTKNEKSQIKGRHSFIKGEAKNTYLTNQWNEIIANTIHIIDIEALFFLSYSIQLIEFVMNLLFLLSNPVDR